MKRSDIEIIGGATEVAHQCGVKPSAVSNWFSRGQIPYKHAKVIVKMFEKANKKVTIEYVMGE